MKTNEPRDDEILGRALSRAIETAEVQETPYDGSRIALRPLKRGTSFWRIAALAATIVVAGALGSTLLDRPATDGPVAQQPSPTVASANTPAATVTPAATPTPRSNSIDHGRIYVSRLDLPPVGFAVPINWPTAEERIAARITDLRALRQDQAPPGTQNLLWNNAFQGGVQVVISGDLATVDLLLEKPWTTSGSAASRALLQQLVYTATEEPGIRRVLFTENGGARMQIDQVVVDKPLTREDVSGYGPVESESEIVTEDQSRPCAPTCPSPVAARLSNNYSVDSVARGVARFVVQVDSGDWQSFTVSKAGSDSMDDAKTPWTSKYALEVKVKGTEVKPGLEIIDQSPLRAIQSVTAGGATTYVLALDDQRPWRVVLLTSPDRVVVDIGGDPSTINRTIAVYSPKPGGSGRQFTLTGLSRTFEATTAWRVVDSARRLVASGYTTASRGTSPVWGTYQVSVQLPAAASGNLTLEVYWPSARDGSDVDVVQIPLTVR